jgi:hypothetical protein
VPPFYQTLESRFARASASSFVANGGRPIPTVPVTVLRTVQPKPLSELAGDDWLFSTRVSAPFS